MKIRPLCASSSCSWTNTAPNFQAGMQVIVADHVELVDSWFQEAIADVGATVLLLFPHHGYRNGPKPRKGETGAPEVPCRSRT